MTVTVIYDDKPTTLDGARTDARDLFVSMDQLRLVAGWEVKQEGVCREDICIPLPSDSAARVLPDAGTFNLAEFARLIDQPMARDEDRNVWYFGPPGWEWKSRQSGVAPDFTLPDFEGQLHSLSDYRGKKVFLLCWASW